VHIVCIIDSFFYQHIYIYIYPTKNIHFLLLIICLGLKRLIIYDMYTYEYIHMVAMIISKNNYNNNNDNQFVIYS